MKHDYSISTIIPVFNERPCIPHAFDEVSRFLGQHFADFEVIIVESGSTDGSAEACDAYANAHERLSVVHETSRNGFGSALKLGFGHACKDLVWTVSVDLPFPLEAVLRALPRFSYYDCVLSYRCDDDRGTFRRAQSVVYNNLVKWTLGLHVTHVNSTFKVYRREVAQGFNFISKGWLVDAEIIYRLQQMQVKHTEIPVPLVDRTTGQSTIGPLTPVWMLWDLARLSVQLPARASQA